MLAVLFAMVKTVAAAPNGTNFMLHMPHTTTVRGVAFSANKDSCQSMLAGIRLCLFRGSVFDGTDGLAAALQLLLY